MPVGTGIKVPTDISNSVSAPDARYKNTFHKRRGELIYILEPYGHALTWTPI